MINGYRQSAFGDTGAGQNVSSDRRAKELGLKIRADPSSFPMGNSNRIFSPGTVEFLIAFEDDPGNTVTTVAHLIRAFEYDLLLGNPFLEANKCLTTFFHGFVSCQFPMKSM
jgi:hypothetical protein